MEDFYYYGRSFRFREGVCEVCDIGVLNIVIECGNMVVINVIKGICKFCWKIDNLIRDMKMDFNFF